MPRRVAWSQVEVGSGLGVGVADKYSEAFRPHLEMLGQQDLVPGLAEWGGLLAILAMLRG